jgi:hypothetical protein
MSLECVFCKRNFSSKFSLKKHQKTAKYCLKIQGKENIPGKFKCKGCGKTFTRKELFIYHDNICKKNKENRQNEQYERKIEEIQKQCERKIVAKDKIILSLKRQLKSQKMTIDKLQKQMQEVALKAVSRPTYNTSNKTIQINNYIKQMEPLRVEHIRESVPMLTLDHHVKGPEGYAEYALEFPFKNRIVCVDVARNKIKYKNDEGDIIEDPGFRKMMMKLCEALKDRSYKLCQDHYEKLLDKFSEEEMDNTDFDFMEAAKAIHKYANGRESDFCSKIIKLISKGATNQT